MLYNRLISAPREASEYPFLPLHAAVKACPSVESLMMILNLYDDHVLDVDLHGCTVTHALCSQDRESMIQQMEVLHMLPEETFFMEDKEGFLPLHRVLTNSETPANVFTAILKRQYSAIHHEMKTSHENSNLEKFLPIQIAAAHNCELDIVFDLFRSTAGTLFNQH